MDKWSPLVIDLPPLSDKSVVEIQRFLEALSKEFESRYLLQICRYYDRNPRQQRPTKFIDEPF